MNRMETNSPLKSRPMKKSEKYINRELSWLEFNQRVLNEAADPKVPLLDRLKFLAISSSNLDEFFMVRVGGLHILATGGRRKKDPSGMTPLQQLESIAKRSQQMTLQQYKLYLSDIEPQLCDAGILRLTHPTMTERQFKILRQIFEAEISSLLTPMAVEEGENFPLLGNQKMNLCVRLESENSKDAPQTRFALIPFGPAAKRFITLPSDGGYEFMLLEDVVRIFASRFFPEEKIVECVPFRITRNADLATRDDLATDLLSEMQDLIEARKFSDCVRLEISANSTSGTFKFLQNALQVRSNDIHAIPGPLDLADFMRLTQLPGYDDFRNKPWPPQRSPQVDFSESMFENIAREEILLFHPYESFEPVLRFVEEAAADPDVLAIKQTLYRTSRESPVVAHLIQASRNGKSVSVIVELKARFDEARNIEWAQNLEKEGVQVIYGVKGLKTHSKLCLVIRREPGGIKRYAHFGTGNYNEVTARIYSDVSFLTSDELLTSDAIGFFNAIAGFSQPPRFQKLAAAPIGLREKLLELIEYETEQCKQGKKAGITAKMNALVDTQIIDALYKASQSGVAIRLLVRGICCLRPGRKGMSETIEVASVIDRYLEHARIFQFEHGGECRIFISSADWMPRNLDRRIELLIPVEDKKCQQRLTAILECQWNDTAKAYKLFSSGEYERVSSKAGEKLFQSQRELFRTARETIRDLEKTQPTMFEPHRSPNHHF